MVTTAIRLLNRNYKTMCSKCKLSKQLIVDESQVNMKLKGCICNKFRKYHSVGFGADAANRLCQRCRPLTEGRGKECVDTKAGAI